MIHWLSQGFSTYILHSQHGNGYQFGSGGPGPLWIAQLVAYTVVVYHVVLGHNCYEHGCPRPARMKGDDGHRRCKRCHRRTHPEYPH